MAEPKALPKLPRLKDEIRAPNHSTDDPHLVSKWMSTITEAPGLEHTQTQAEARKDPGWHLFNPKGINEVRFDYPENTPKL